MLFTLLYKDLTNVQVTINTHTHTHNTHIHTHGDLLKRIEHSSDLHKLKLSTLVHKDLNYTEVIQNTQRFV